MNTVLVDRCHNCRRRRLRCDRSIPSCQKCIKAGQECLGYGKLYRWNQGIASRGKMMGKSFEIPARPQSSAEKSTPESSMVPALANRASGSQESSLILSKSNSANINGPKMSIRPCLLDPLFEGLDYMSRYYVSHFANKLCQDLVTYDVPEHNPYRNLIPLTKNHPHLLHIIIANSAIYISNTFTQPMRSTPQSALSLPTSTLEDNFQRANEMSVLSQRDALVAKQKSLYLLRHALDNIDNIDTLDREVVLITIFLSINFELVNSGKDDWKVHVEGARKLIDSFQLPSGTPGSTMALLHDYVVSDCIIYYVLGSAFLSQKSRASGMQHAPNVLPMLERAEANSYISCPAVLLQIMLSASHLSDQEEEMILEEERTPIDHQAEQASHLLEEAQSFDVYAWAACVQGVSSHNDFECRVHVAKAHKAAVCLYIHRVVPSARLLNKSNIECLVHSIISNLSSIPPGEQLLKGTSWSAFIAGAESKDPEQQAWAVGQLYALWEILPWGYVRTAIELLRTIWDMKDTHNLSADEDDGWLQKLKALGNEWIVV